MGNAGSAPEQAKKSSAAADAAGSAADAEVRRAPPSTVRFVPDADRNKARQAPPIKLEEEGAPPPPATDEEMAPRNLWQVYALGAFIVLRWAWAKWKENHQDRKDSGWGWGCTGRIDFILGCCLDVD